MQVLIIEDEILILKSLQRSFTVAGHNVKTTTSGKTAIDYILNHDYDLIICDLMLQDISGFDVIEESKKKFPLDQIKKKFTIITAYSSPQILEKITRYGCKLVTKPFKNHISTFLQE